MVEAKRFAESIVETIRQRLMVPSWRPWVASANRSLYAASETTGAVGPGDEHRTLSGYTLLDLRSHDEIKAALEKLGGRNRAHPQPSRLVEVLFYDHPPIAEHGLFVVCPQGHQGKYDC